MFFHGRMSEKLNFLTNILEVTRKIILCRALFVFILNFRPLNIWFELRKQNIGPASFGLGPQICYTSILFFLFHEHGEKKIVVNFP